MSNWLEERMEGARLGHADLWAYIDKLEARVGVLREALQERDRLLTEALGWMAHVDPKPAQPFLDEIGKVVASSGDWGSALVASPDKPPCDGSRSCPAEEHIQGCFRSKVERG